MTPSGCAQQPGPISAPHPRFSSLQWNRLLGWRAHPQGHLQRGRPRRGNRSPAEEALGTANSSAGLAEDAMGTDVVADGAPKRPRAHQPKVMPLKRMAVICQLDAAARARRHCHTHNLRGTLTGCQDCGAAGQGLASNKPVPCAQQAEKHDNARCDDTAQFWYQWYQ